MKRLLFCLLALALLPLVGGCQAGVNVGPVSPDQFVTSLSHNAAAVEASASVATRLALLSVSEDKRHEATAEVHLIAQAVSQTLADNPDISGFKDRVLELIAKSDGRYSELAGVIFDATSGVIDAELSTQYSKLSASDKGKAALTLARAVTSGVLKATVQTFSVPRHVPTPRPAEHSSIWEPTRSRLVSSPFEHLCLHG